MITFVFNPLSLVAKAAETSFPDIKAEVQFVPGLANKSSKDFYIGSGVAIIDINADLSLEEMLDEMMDVFAEVGSETLRTSGSKFLYARKKIQKEFEKLMETSLLAYKK